MDCATLVLPGYRKHKKEAMMKNFKTILLITLLLIVTLTGCSKLNQENYDRIEIGMDYQNVTEIIGQPDKCDAALGTKNCTWGNDEKNITVKFVADKVALPTMKGL
jgi:hypothetical protein